MTHSQYKAPLFITIHTRPRWRYDTALPYTRPRNPISPYSTQSQTYSLTLFIPKDLSYFKRSSQTAACCQKSFVFPPIIPRKFLSHKYTNFISNKSPREYSFLFLSAFRTKLYPFWDRLSHKKTKRQPAAVASS